MKAIYYKRQKDVFLLTNSPLPNEIMIALSFICNNTDFKYILKVWTYKNTLKSLKLYLKKLLYLFICLAEKEHSNRDTQILKRKNYFNCMKLYIHFLE